MNANLTIETSETAEALSDWIRLITKAARGANVLGDDSVSRMLRAESKLLQALEQGKQSFEESR